VSLAVLVLAGIALLALVTWFAVWLVVDARIMRGA
jgi:hypothetical protein